MKEIDISKKLVNRSLNLNKYGFNKIVVIICNLLDLKCIERIIIR